MMQVVVLRTLSSKMVSGHMYTSQSDSISRHGVGWSSLLKAKIIYLRSALTLKHRKTHISQYPFVLFQNQGASLKPLSFM